VADLSRVILDTNTLLRGFANHDSASGPIISLCERRNVLLLLSRPVVAEYRRVLGSKEILRRNPDITTANIELVLRRLRYVGHFLADVRARFHLARHPDDEPFLELAIDGSATHLITNDNDMLALVSEHDDAAKRFRQRLHGLRIIRPEQFIREYRSQEL
jgi:putative PIN family toxin of toxin-antitoxin system